MLLEFRYFLKFIQLYYKSKSAFKVCYIKIGENIATCELHILKKHRG